MPNNPPTSQHGKQTAQIGGISLNKEEAALMSSSGHAAKDRHGSVDDLLTSANAL